MKLGFNKKDMIIIYQAYKQTQNARLVSKKFNLSYKKTIKIINYFSNLERIKRFRNEGMFQFDLSRSENLIIDGDKIKANNNKKGYYRDKEGNLIRLWIGAIVDDLTSNLYFQYFVLRGGENFLNLVNVLFTLLKKEEILKPFGLPKMLLIDNASGFKKENKFKEIMEKKLGVKVIYQSPAHPQSKGKVERAIRTIKQTFEKDLLLSNFEGTLEELNELAKKFCHNINIQKEMRFLPSYVLDFDFEEVISLFFDNILERKVNKGMVNVNNRIYYIPNGISTNYLKCFEYNRKVYAILNNSIVELNEGFETIKPLTFDNVEFDKKTITEEEFELTSRVIFLNNAKKLKLKKKEEDGDFKLCFE